MVTNAVLPATNLWLPFLLELNQLNHESFLTSALETTRLRPSNLSDISSVYLSDNNSLSSANFNFNLNNTYIDNINNYINNNNILNHHLYIDYLFNNYNYPEFGLIPSILGIPG